MAYGEVDSPERPRKRRGRRLLITLLVLVVLLGVLLAVADRVAVNMAEERIARQVSQQLADRDVRSTPPEVTVGGFPFLTQVVGENYESISILLRDVEAQAGQAGVKLPRLDVRARDVKATIDTLRTGQGDIVARTVEGTATIGYASVAQQINQPDLRLTERGGKLLATLPVQLFGQELTLTGEAQLTAADGKVNVRFEELDAEGLPSSSPARSAVNAYARQLSIDLPLPELPFGLQVREVRPLPEGLAVTATGQDVPLNQAPA